MSQHSSGGRPWRRAREAMKRVGAPCYLCGQPIDYTLPKLDPMSFQRDHVIPKDLGGSDAPSNCRATHRKCNRAKSNKMIAPVMKRSGSLRRQPPGPGPLDGPDGPPTG